MYYLFRGLQDQLVGNDSEIIPLKEVVNISPTCSLLEMESGQQRERQWGGQTQAEQIFSRSYLSLSPAHKHTVGACFSTQTDAQLNCFIENKEGKNK